MEWIKCSERLPEDSGKYIVTVVFPGNAGYVTPMNYSAKYKRWNARDDASPEVAAMCALHPTFWQPLPELPEGVTAC